MGIPYVPMVALAGSDLLKRRDDMRLLPDPFQPDEQTLVAKAMRPDVALFHGLRADRAGNVELGKHTDDVLLAEASAAVIVTVEQIVEHLDEDEASGTFLPGILVDVVVEAPAGAHPAGLPGAYGIDEAHMRHYAEQARSDEGFQAYLDEVVHGVADHADYVRRFVPTDVQRAGLRAAGD